MTLLSDSFQQKRERFLRYASRNSRWVVRDYLARDEEGITLLFQKVFQLSFSDAQWRWKYLHNPAGEAIIKVAVSNADGAIIGHQAAIPMRFKIAESRLTGYLSVDSMIDENFRGSGLFAELSLRLWEDVRKRGNFVFGFPNESAHASTLKLGARKILPLQLFFRVLKSHSNLFSRRLSLLHLHALKWVCQFSKINADLDRWFCKDKFSVYEVTQFDERIEELWDRLSVRYPIAVIRDQAYLNWRYCENKDETYKKFLILRDSKILGYAILAINERWGCRVGVLADWLLDPAESTAGLFLWNHCETYLRSQDVSAVGGFFSLMQENIHFLKKTGFLSLNPRQTSGKFDLMLLPDVLRRELSAKDFQHMTEPKNWFLTLGDTDTV